VLWRDVDLDLGVHHVTSTLIRVTGECLVRGGAGPNRLQHCVWCHAPPVRHGMALAKPSPSSSGCCLGHSGACR
jgi:hypothetical protein